MVIMLFSLSKELTQILPCYRQIYYHLLFTYRETEAQRGEESTWWPFTATCCSPARPGDEVCAPPAPAPPFCLPGPLTPGLVSEQVTHRSSSMAWAGCQCPLAAPWCPRGLEHTGVVLSARPQAPRTDPAQRGIRRWALWPMYLSLTITVSSFTGYKALLCFPSDPQQDEYQHLYFGVSIPPLCRWGKWDSMGWITCLNHPPRD